MYTQDARGDYEAKQQLLHEEDRQLRDDESDLEDGTNAVVPVCFTKWKCTLQILGCVVFLSTTSFIPVWNKFIFNRNFHFPLFTTTVYLMFCGAGGLLYFGTIALLRCVFGLFQKHHSFSYLWWKKIIWATFPVGIAFGLKLGLTNYGLDLVSVDYHVLFQASSILWVAVAGVIILGEIPTGKVCVLIFTMIIGEVMLSLQFGKEQSASITGIAVNLASPILEGACVVLMRYAAVQLFPQWITRHQMNVPIEYPETQNSMIDNKLDSSGNALYHSDAIIAFTTVKLIFSGLTCLPFAIFKEQVFAKDTIWDAFQDETEKDKLIMFLLIGALITFLLQASLVLLCMLSLALTVGVLGLLKVIPQLIAGLLFNSRQFDPTILHIVGIVIILFSCTSYAFVRQVQQHRQ